MILRLRKLIVGGAVASAGATAVFAIVPGLDLTYHAPTLHAALETTAAMTASAAAFLLLGRFRRTGSLDELILSAGLSLLALSSLTFFALPAVFDLEWNRASVWGSLFAGTVAAILICLGALLPRRRLGDGRRWPVAVYGGTLALAIAGTLPIVAFHDRLPRAVTSSLPLGASGPHFVGHPAVLTMQLALALLYVLAAFGFARRHRIAADELSGWLALAWVLSAAAHVDYVFHPSLYSNWLYTGDVCRVGSYLVLLVGAAREISSYWATAVGVAALEERRQLARNVHDGLAQEIAFIGRNVRLLRERGVEPDVVERILGGVARALQESRRMVGALETPLDASLEEELVDAARRAAERYGVSLEMQLEHGFDLTPARREEVVRIASEAVTNAARHSGADRLLLNLEHLHPGMRLEVVDEGVGFEDGQQASRGFGLTTMRERAEALGGHLRIDSRPGAGTRVELDL